MDLITVGLETSNDWLRAELEEIIAGQDGFRLTPHDRNRIPHLLILELDQDRGKTFSQIQITLAASPATEIFLTSPSTEPEALLEALRAGVKEFIPQPLNRQELVEALARCRERHKERKPDTTKYGKVITLIGSKGSVGTTTIAVNLAVSLRQAHEQSSAVLVDLNPQFGDAALFLDLEPTHTMGDVAQNVARLDETFLMSVLSKHASGLYVLPSVDAVEDIGLLTPEAVERTLVLLQTMFDYVIIDSGDSLADTTLAALNLSSAVYLVCNLTLPVLRNTKRLLDILAHLNYPINNINLIVNRYEKHTEVSIADLEEILRLKASWIIPNDYSTTMNAINKGQPLSAVASRADVTKSFRRIAQSLMIEEHKEHKSSFFSRLFKSN